MNINDFTIYVFTRNDLPLGQDDIQTNHASFHLGMVVAARFGNVPGIPFMITKEKLKTKSLNKLIRYCGTTDLPHYAMQDDDVDKENPTALAVIAATDGEKEFFRKYPLRNYVPAVAQAAALNGEAGANADVAQGGSQEQAEHSVINGEVAGADPAVSSTHFNCS